MDDWNRLISVILGVDLIVNLFFHLLALRKLCKQHATILNICRRVAGLEHSVSLLDDEQRDIGKRLSQHLAEDEITEPTNSPD